SLRFFDIEEGKQALEVVKRIADATAQAHECTVEFHPSFEMKALPGVNDASLATQARQGMEDILTNALKPDVTWIASEPSMNIRNLPLLYSLLLECATKYMAVGQSIIIIISTWMTMP